MLKSILMRDFKLHVGVHVAFKYSNKSSFSLGFFLPHGTHLQPFFGLYFSQYLSNVSPMFTLLVRTWNIPTIVQYVPTKIFLTSKFNYLFFCNPTPIKLKQVLQTRSNN